MGVTTLLSIPTLQLHFVFPSQPPVLISWQTSPRTENSRSLSNLFALENTALISLSIFLASIGHGLFGYLTISQKPVTLVTQFAMASGIPYTPKPATDIFTPYQTDINRRECKRIVPMRVLALGLGRTGTASLRSALKELGYTDTYHMMSASVENPPDCLCWMDAFAAKFEGKGKFGREEWDALFGHCQAVCDWPAVAFAKELIEAYPEAKVIITTRDVDSWHASVMKTVCWRANDPELRAVANFDWAAGLYHPMLRKFWKYFFNDDFENSGKERFHEYYKEIRELVPPGQLLEYRVSSGWRPLCEYLGEPVPDKPFPRSNDAENFVQRCRTQNRKQMMNVLLEPRGGQIVCFIFDYGNGLYIVWRLDFMPSCVSLATGVQGACILSLWT